MDKLNIPITIVGAGAIGSFTAQALSKCGFGNITVYDFDTVSEENMSCQWYGPGDIGRPKVEALRDNVKQFSGFEIDIVNDKYRDQVHAGIVISALDNMATRSQIYEAHKTSYGKTKLIIDPRMAAEEANIYTCDPNKEESRKSYEVTLFPDSEGVHEPCTAKSTTYTALLIGGMVCKIVKDYVTQAEVLKSVLWSIKLNDMVCA